MEALKKFVEHFGDYGKEVMALGNFGNKVLKWIFEGIVMLSMFFPIDSNLFEDNSGGYLIVVVTALSVATVLFEIQHYVIQHEEGKTVSVFQKLVYVPVEKKMIRKLLRRRLLRHVGIMVIFAAIIQVSMTLIFCPQYVWQNILYIVCTIGVTPFIAGLLLIYIRR